MKSFLNSIFIDFSFQDLYIKLEILNKSTLCMKKSIIALLINMTYTKLQCLMLLSFFLSDI